MDGRILIPLGFAIIMVGVIILLGGILLQALAPNAKTEIKGGGVVMIGPIPVIFGTGRASVLITVILAIILMAMFYVITRTR